MANGTIAAGAYTYSSTLVASTADTVTVVDRYGYVQVCNTSTTGLIYVRADGVAATVGGANTQVINPGQCLIIANQLPTWFPSSRVTIAGSAQIPEGGGAPTTTPSTTNPTTWANPGRETPMMAAGAGGMANPGASISIIGAAANTYTVSVAG